jgi:monovalent cation:H+ antiporter-2, CPA2 family
LPNSLLTESIVVIVASACSVGLLKRIGLPPIVGYLVAGLAIGPHGFALLAPSHGTQFLSELGVVLLMFMIGLEFSLPKMIAARTTVFGAGGLQVALTSSMVAVTANAFGIEWPAAIIIGGGIAMSSTAITLKQLSDEGDLGSQHGRLAIGVLLFQDLATLPFLVLVSAGQDQDISALSFLRQFLIAGVAFAIIGIVARPAFRAALSWAAGAKSPELFLLCSLVLALGTAFAAHAVGLSPPIGAFLAGMVVGESDFRHQIEDDIRPFRDVLVGLFFVTIGMQVDLSIIAGAPWSVLGWLIMFVLGKTVLVALVVKALRWPTFVALRVGVILGHGGEFGLLLLTQAMAAGVVDVDLGQPVLFALTSTMALAPILIQQSSVIARFVSKTSMAAHLQKEETRAHSGRNLHDHVILCGCGRVGRLVALVLEAAKISYLAIESDLTRFRETRRSGHNVIFGDGSRSRFLDRAGVEGAKLLVVTFDERQAVARLLHHARHRNPAIASIISAADDVALSELADAGATVVFPENLAAGLALADQALLLSGLSQEQAARVISEVRADLV